MQASGDSLSAPRANHGLPPRVETLHNVPIIGRGGAKVIAPDPEVMEAIGVESGGKVRHFPTDMEALDQESGQIGESGFYRCVVRPLANHLAVAFPGRRLALRAVGTSINGTQQTGLEDLPELRDVTETVGAGTEKPGDIFNVQVLDADEPFNTHQISHYAHNMAGLKALEMSEDMADAAFPTVLVYDTEGLVNMNGNYGVSFREGHNPSEVLLAAYVVDSPV